MPRPDDASLRVLLESSQLPMWLFDAETFAFLYVNQPAIRRYGFSRDEFLAMHVPDIRPQPDTEATRRFMSGQPRTQIGAGEWRHRTKRGEVIWVDVRLHPVRYDDRDAFCVLIEPIPERRRLEQELQEFIAAPMDVPGLAGCAALVIDADAKAANVTAEGLRALGLAVTVAEDPWAGVASLRDLERSLAFVAIDVTNEDGAAAFNAIRARVPSAPVMLTTPFGQSQALAWLARSEGLWSIQKPFTAVDVSRVVAAAVEFAAKAAVLV